MSRLTVQTAGEWIPFADPWCIGVLDCTTAQATAAFGWAWDEVEEDGLGPMRYLPLAWDGRSRFLLSASGSYPENGIAIETSASENAADARRDLLEDLGLTPEALLAYQRRRRVVRSVGSTSERRRAALDGDAATARRTRMTGPVPPAGFEPAISAVKGRRHDR